MGRRPTSLQRVLVATVLKYRNRGESQISFIPAFRFAAGDPKSANFKARNPPRFA